MSYQIFLDALTQLEEDQSFFEAELGQELQGIHHEELVRLGGKMGKKLRLFANVGQSFAESLQPDFLTKVIQTVQEYEHLIMPPKVFGGFCPCLKPARDGPEYDKKFRATLAKVVATLFVCQAVVIENAGEKLNMDSMHFVDYSNRMNTLHTTLGSISTKGNEQAREGCRVELLASVDAVNRFMKSFDADTEEFRAESRRRLASTSELLSIPAEGGIGRRILVKAQSSLQEIMNSAAFVSMKKSKESMAALESLATDLKNARDSEISAFNEMESKMQESNLMDVLHRLREDSEVVHSEASCKLRDAIKRWATVKKQSSPRAVAEYREESALAFQTPVGLGSGESMDPDKLIRDAGTKIGHMGMIAVNMPGKAAVGGVKAAIGVVNMGMTGVVKGGKGAVTGISNGANMAIKAGKTAVQPVEKLFGIETDTTQNNNNHNNSSNSNQNNKKGVNGMFAGAGAFFNPLDL